jgi:hypothetical protein
MVQREVTREFLLSGPIAHVVTLDEDGTPTSRWRGSTSTATTFCSARCSTSASW